MPFPLIAMLAKTIGSKVAAKGASKAGAKAVEAGAKGAAKAGVEGAAKAGTKNFAQKGMQKLGNFEGKKLDAAQKSGGRKDEPGLESIPWPETQAYPKQFHKGGRVKKTGWAKVKKNERVLTKAQQKALAHKVGKKKVAKNSRKVKTAKKKIVARKRG